MIRNADGSGNMNLTDGSLDCRALAWYQDGARIIFSASEVEGNFDLYVINVDGSDLTNLTNSPDRNEGNPLLSSDETKIVFSVDNFDLNISNADGSNPRFLAEGMQASWSPDGSRIAYVYGTSETQSDLFIVNPDGSGQRNLTENSTIVVGGYMSPAWSPDGTQILFSTHPIFVVSDIYRVNADGSGLTNLTNTPDFNESSPIWSPDGTQIAFVGEPHQSRNYDIFLMLADGSGNVNLTNGSIKDLSTRLHWRPLP